jgi:hypothetical protein
VLGCFRETDATAIMDAHIGLRVDNPTIGIQQSQQQQQAA